MSMKELVLRSVVLVFSAMFVSRGHTQDADSLVNRLDSLERRADTAGQQNLVDPGFYNEKTRITARVFGVLLLDDFKQQALSPFRPTKKTLIRDAVVLGIGFGMSFLDKPIQRNAMIFRRENPGILPYSQTLSDLGGQFEIVPLVAIAATGIIFKKPKLRTTTALAAQAFITATVWSTIFKEISGRKRPQSYEPGSPLNEPSFHGPFYKLPNGQNSAFPSGHTTLAFAAATVYAKEYKNIKGVPIASYGLATLISVSRITQNRHWITDLLAGGLLGWACGSQVVNNYHRYARLVRTDGLRKKPKKGTLTPTISTSSFGRLQPGFVYRFH